MGRVSSRGPSWRGLRIGALLSASVVAGALAAVAAGPAVAQEGPPERPDTRQVMFVGNNWEGTADLIDATTFERLGRINVIPDKEERLAEIHSSPDKLAFFLLIRQFVGEGNDQYVDDMFTTHDGELVAVSRPSFADVVGISLQTHEIVWRFPMEGYRSDHMAVSPDGTRIFHASIGRVYTPTDRTELGPVRDASKGQRYFQVVDSESLEILSRVDMGQKLEEAGYPDMDSAVRPMALSPDERVAYLQISFHHGFVEYDLEQERVLRVADLPISEGAQNTPREEYLLDSAHHGIAMNPDGTKLCVAGTMSDYAAIVSRSTFQATVFPVGEKPYWSTNGLGGGTCWVSFSGDDSVGIFDYASEQQIATVPVGDHPQRVRRGAVQTAYLPGLPQP